MCRCYLSILVLISQLVLSGCLFDSGSSSSSPSAVAPTPTPMPTPTPAPVVTKVFGYSGSQYSNLVYSFSIDKSTGSMAPTAGVSATAQSAPMLSAASFDKKFLMSANYSSHSVSTFSISATSGDLVSVGNTSLGSGTSPAWIASHPTLRVFYTANSGNSTISVVDVDSSGNATVRGSVAAGSGVTALAITPDGGVLYSVDQNMNQIGIYQVAGDGGLTSVGTATTPASSTPNHAVVSADGTRLYVANWGTANVSTYSISGITLNSLGEVSGGTGGIYTISLSPDGKFLYSAKPYGHNFSMHAIDPTTKIPGVAVESSLSGSVNFAFWNSFAFLVSWSNGVSGLPVAVRNYDALGVAASNLSVTTDSYRGLYQLVVVEVEQP